MLAKRFFILSTAIALGCSSTPPEGSSTTGGVASNGGSSGAGVAMGGHAGSAGGTNATGGATSETDALVLPSGIDIMPQPGGAGVFDLFALTLRKGPTNTELYAALKSTGDMVACGAGLAVELFDKDQQSMATSVSGLHMSHVYRLTDGSGAVSSCAGRGDIVMAAITDLPADLAIEDVGYVVYRCPYFALDVVPINGLSVSNVQVISASGGVRYSGIVTNGLDVAVNNPSIVVFPVNHAGRPLGVATGNGTEEIAPAGTWAFDTNAADSTSMEYAAYAGATVVK